MREVNLAQGNNLWLWWGTNLGQFDNYESDLCAKPMYESDLCTKTMYESDLYAKPMYESDLCA